MSISNSFDAWLEERGLTPIVEVVPDHSCQEFLPADGVILVPADGISGKSHTSLGETIELLRELLA
ncbi:hypothetical protein [Corynebacterium sp. A21]|uniref:hypothetical protein n=1 Tax=Corynebacterium sp. A21 TaxID=3457318 RepID=UPI003FD48CB5